MYNNKSCKQTIVSTADEDETQADSTPPHATQGFYGQRFADNSAFMTPTQQYFC